MEDYLASQRQTLVSHVFTGVFFTGRDGCTDKTIGGASTFVQYGFNG